MSGQTPTLITLVTEVPHSNGETPSIRLGGDITHGAGNPSTITTSQAEQGPTIFEAADPQPGPELDGQLQASSKRREEGHSTAPGGSNVVLTNVNDGDTGTTINAPLLQQAAGIKTSLIEINGPRADAEEVSWVHIVYELLFAGTKTSLIETNGPRADAGEELSWIHIVYKLLFGLWTLKNGDKKVRWK